MFFEDWELLTDDKISSAQQGSTQHRSAPHQVSDLLGAPRACSVLEAIPKSRPLQRPVYDTTPRIRAHLQHVSRPVVDQQPCSTSGPSFRVSQLQHAQPLQRPQRHSAPVVSASLGHSDTPLPVPQMRSGYIATAGPAVHVQPLTVHSDVSQPHEGTKQSMPRPPRKLQQHAGRTKKQRPLQPSRNQECSSCPAVQAIWPQFLSAFLQLSPMLQDLSNSMHFDEHCQRILYGFAASTIYRYLSTLMQFHAACISLRVSLEGLSEIQLADILLAGRSSEPKVSSSMCIKSIRWAFKQFGIACFQVSMGPLISSFTKEHVVSDRREALPYSLLTIVQWERRMLQSSATQQEILGLGSFLLMLWSGMRFADLQRTRLNSLAYDMISLRGLSFRTKTCKSGCPFGLICKGFLSTGSFTWVHRYLQALDSLYSNSGMKPQDVDFIIPSLDSLDHRDGPSPMSYAEALYFCRHFLSLPWRKSPVDTAASAQHYTVHGLKSTLLSFANQLQLAPELRRLQGKHKDPMQSTRLYSRDDVNGALQLQEAIVASVQKGWRPHTPLGRGGQIPIQEQSFTLEQFRKDVVEPNWSFFSFNRPPTFEFEQFDSGETNHSDTSSSSSDSSDSSSSSSPLREQQSVKRSKAVPDSFDEILMGVYRKTWHVVMNPPQGENVPPEWRWNTACGRRFTPDQFSIRDELALNLGHILCSHPGCKKGWISVGILTT
eukprot:s7_g88.t1